MYGNMKIEGTAKTIRNPGPIPKIEIEESVPRGGLNHLAWIDDYRKGEHYWYAGLPWYERLHALATMNSFRRNVGVKRPFAPKDELDYVLEAIYDPQVNMFAEKQDPYMHKETVFGEDLNLVLVPKRTFRQRPNARDVPENPNLYESKWKEPSLPLCPTWRVLRNRMVVYPPVEDARGHPLVKAPLPWRRDSVYNVKLGIAADHSPQTNPGFSRTPSGSFYGI